jgi:precorrin-3B C17-methyltransferase
VTGRLTIVGLGPGADELQTPQARAALEAATDLFGYTTYLDRVPTKIGQSRYGSDNREEITRARAALELAYTGKDVAVVSSGDPGVFAMAAAVFEAIENGEPEWREIEVTVVPGISAMFAAAARLGAPLGHDFCAISLSDNLKPWETVIRRLEAAASADFVIALYNPISKARPWQLGAALDLLRAHRAPSTPVIFAAAVSRGDEEIEIADLATADPARADMRTLVMIGSSATRLVPRPNGAPWVYTPRSVEEGRVEAECVS